MVTNSKVALRRLLSQPVRIPGCLLSCPRGPSVPGQGAYPARKVAQVPDSRYALMAGGVAVVSAPAGIEAADAEQLRILLLKAGGRSQATVVVCRPGVPR